ncbi:hypothetical protein BDF21DRAFT_396368 [Thamnidium elegans]|nr:hypothetical protein BDF21DRAFT_396368 [Thamnidium elegans]
MPSKFLSVLLMPLVFVVACAAAPAVVEINTNATEIPERISPRAMGCTTKGHVKVCTNSDKSKVVSEDGYNLINEHFRYDLPDWKKTNRHALCVGDICGSMSTLTGSQFVPKDYDHVAYMAASDFLLTEVCETLLGLTYPTAIDIYYYEYNFVFSWWTTGDRWIGICYKPRPILTE